MAIFAWLGLVVVLFAHWSIAVPLHSKMSQCSDVVPEDRVDCGFSMVSSEECLRRGCCWQPREGCQFSVPWCYQHPNAILKGCTDMRYGEREECGYGVDNATECASSDCCWVPSGDPGAPWCFYHPGRVPSTTLRTKTASSPEPTTPYTTPQTTSTATTPAPTITTTTARPLTKATYFMTCDNIPRDEQNRADISGLCWFDKDTLVVAQHENKQLLKVKVNMDTKSCGVEVIDYGYSPKYLSCSTEGMIYASGYGGTRRIAYVYDLKTGNKEIWEIEEMTRMITGIGSNKDYVVFNQYLFSFVYAQNKTLLYKIQHEDLFSSTTDVYITYNDMLWGASTQSLALSNLKTRETRLIIDDVTNNWYISGTSDGHVFVTDTQNQKVVVYSEEGTFLHFLEFDPPEGWSKSLRYNDIIEFSSGKAILAYAKDTGDVKFYHLDLET